MYLGEDSFFLSEQLKKHLEKQDKNIKILDIGAGTGIQAETCLNLGFNNITAVDIGKEEIKYLKNKFNNKIKIIESDLFDNIKKTEKFNLMVFNPPYLPENKFDCEKDTTAGKQGHELILRFVKQAKNHLEKDGKILLLFSSFSNPKKILEESIKSGYKHKLIAKKQMFFEELLVYQFFIWT